MTGFALLWILITALVCSYGLLYPNRLRQQANIGLRLETPIAISEMRAT